MIEGTPGWDVARVGQLRELEEKLDRTNELLHNMLKVLSSTG
jgi:hypothetical protein